MALKSVVEKLDDVPEALREHYVEENGSFVLATDGNDRLKEFRTNNITLKQKAEELETKLKSFEGIDPAKYQELATLERQKRDKELIEAGDVETLLNEKLTGERSTYQKQLDAIKAELEKTKGELVATKVTDTLKTAAADAGVLPKAMNDMVKLASSDWELRDGRPTMVQNGEVVLSKEKAGEPITMGEYFKNMLHEKPFYFQSSSGAGGTNSLGTAGGVRVVPNDPYTMGRYAEQIANGEVVVEGTE